MTGLDATLLSEKLLEAKIAWPEVEIGEASFAAAIAASLEDGSGSVADVFTSDLYLVLGCLAQQPRAIAAFEKHVLGPIRPSVERACQKSSSAVDDILQRTREKLLVGAPPSPPKLAQYTGRGPLTGWVRVVAVREALQDRRRSKRERVVDDGNLLENGSELNPELVMLRERHGPSFGKAVQDALRRLTAEERTLLRLHTRDGLTIDALAPILGVHRATAARRLERAREAALGHTRAILRERHGMSESEARSLCLALGGDIDVSIGRALSEEGLA